MSKKVVIMLGVIVVAIIVIVSIFMAKKSQKVAIDQQQNAVQQQAEQQSEQSSKGENQQENDTDKWKVYENKENELVWYEIPEIKIKFKVNKEVAEELVYNFKGENDFGSVLFSSKGLSKIPGCGVEQGPLSALSKIKGNPYDYADTDYYVSRKPKQFDNFFIIYNGPQAVCATGDYVKKWNEYFEKNPKFIGWIAESFDTIEIIDKK